jgi:N-acetylneuraminic acid mutarotase
LYNPSTGQWKTTNSMNYNRDLHGAAMLANGHVLVAGGNSNPTYPNSLSAELYSPGTGKWTVTGSLNLSHIDQQAVLLLDGRVFMGEIYSNGQWSLTSQPNASSSRIALLTNGDVLVVGGTLYNPATNTWTKTGPVGISTFGPLTRLLNAKVLLAGGEQSTYAGPRASALCALYDPSSNSWERTASLITARVDHSTTLLPDGRVLAVGGRIKPSVGIALASAELYTP